MPVAVGLDVFLLDSTGTGAADNEGTVCFEMIGPKLYVVIAKCKKAGLRAHLKVIESGWFTSFRDTVTYFTQVHKFFVT